MNTIASMNIPALLREIASLTDEGEIGITVLTPKEGPNGEWIIRFRPLSETAQAKLVEAAAYDR